MKAFLKAGILCEDGAESDTDTGTPQGGILSPVLANVALSVLDEHFAESGINPRERARLRRGRRRRGLANYRLVRYADDWVLAVSGTKAHAEATPRPCARKRVRSYRRWVCACRRGRP